MLRFTKLVNVYLYFSFFTAFLKNRNISSKIKRSKVTDYAALNNIVGSTLFYKRDLLSINAIRNPSRWYADDICGVYVKKVIGSGLHNLSCQSPLCTDNEIIIKGKNSKRTFYIIEKKDISLF